MRKRLAFAVLLAIILPISGHCQSPKPDGNQPNGNGTANPTPPPSRMVTCEVKQEGTTIECQWPESVPEGYFKRLFSPENTPNIALVLVGIAGIVAALFTLKKIERQIKVAESDTQAMIRAERAWIVVSVDEFPVGVYRFWAENKGKTPARTVSFWGESLYVARETKYDEKPDETTRGALLQFPPCLMPPGDKRVVWECHRSAIEAASGGGKGKESRFARGFGAGFIYGRIRYFDVLDAKPQEPHETRWLYWLIPQPGSVPFPHPLQPERNTYT
jgi:hypothetical protein